MVNKISEASINCEVAEYLKQLHEEIAEERGILLHSQEVMPDHVHLFVTAHPKNLPPEGISSSGGRMPSILMEGGGHVY